VAYCPYCGRAPASEPIAVAVDIPTEPDPVVAVKPAEPAESWQSWARPLAAGALLGVLLVVLAALVLKVLGQSP
jgi:hypothetical protein